MPVANSFDDSKIKKNSEFSCQLLFQNKIALFRNVIPVPTPIANSFADLGTKTESATGNSVASCRFRYWF